MPPVFHPFPPLPANYHRPHGLNAEALLKIPPILPKIRTLTPTGCHRHAHFHPLTTPNGNFKGTLKAANCEAAFSQALSARQDSGCFPKTTACIFSHHLNCRPFSQPTKTFRICETAEIAETLLKPQLTLKTRPLEAEAVCPSTPFSTTERHLQNKILKA